MIQLQLPQEILLGGLMNNFTSAGQDAADTVRKKISSKGKLIWFPYNPLEKACFLVKQEDVNIFKKWIAITLIPALFIAAVGAVYSFKNGISTELELLITIPALVAYFIGLAVYFRTAMVSEKQILEINPFSEIANELSKKMKVIELSKAFLVVAGGSLLFLIASIVIYAKGHYLIALLIWSLLVLGVKPILLVLLALLKAYTRKRHS
jgi:hypothetical protein